MNEKLIDTFESGACVNITRARERYHRLQIVVHGDEYDLEQLQRETGLGRIYSDGWHIESAQAEKLLRMVAPHVEEKKEHVRVALKFRDTYGSAGEISGVTQELRDKYMRELSRLNRDR